VSTGIGAPDEPANIRAVANRDFVVAANIGDVALAVAGGAGGV